MKILKTISKELIRFAIFSIIFIGVSSTIASQTPTNNQKPTDETGQPTELASDFSTGDIISANTLNNMKIHWDNITEKPEETEKNNFNHIDRLICDAEERDLILDFKPISNMDTYQMRMVNMFFHITDVASGTS
jgi:hypothetical protein